MGTNLSRQSQHRPKHEDSWGKEKAAYKQEIGQLRRLAARLRQRVVDLEQQLGVVAEQEEPLPPSEVLQAPEIPTCGCGAIDFAYLEMATKTLRICKKCKDRVDTEKKPE